MRSRLACRVCAERALSRDPDEVTQACLRLALLSQRSRSSAGRSMRELTLAQAINEALAEELRRDPRVFIIGEDVAEAGTPSRC